ncbi:signal transduction histidine kinase/integral membrane sensor domain MASE1 [Nocardioides sp. BE266]|uniref:ATP-binding protein n=1 Tax=Nocardioides sp. BE266 TaxID=2817725 RepID=UPI002858977C|nr:ATP-binding protein [Nocardioides sp. BE266]MDR7254833.1 signal transduction histidine kinase/integral membrane sensor domain MASE1 [Nocardioides sp. BE266]
MRPRTPLALPWAAGFGVAYALLAVVARLTVIDGQTVSLVWPGAGVAMLWLLAESPSRQLRVLAPLLAIHAGVVWATGAPYLVVLSGSLSVTFQTWLTVTLMRRWCPTLLGAGGTESFRSPRTLARTCGAAALGSAAGALIGAVGVWASGSSVDAWVPQAWFTRHFAGILVVGCIGHLAWEWYTQHVAPRARGGSRLELVLLWAVSLLALVAIFVQPLPLAFVVVSLCVWSAARFPTYLAAIHALTLGLGALVLTLAGLGPFASMGDPVEAAVLTQVFLVTVLLTGLGVGTLSDRIDELVARTARAQERAAEQATLLAEMTESMGEGLVVVGADGSIERSNGASRRLAHRVRPGVPDSVALTALVELVVNPDAANTGALRAELGVGDVQVPLDSGEEIVLAVSRAVLPSRRGEESGSAVLLVLREVTEHRQGLRPLVSFASTAAHDLRGPLTAIRSWIGLATEDMDADTQTYAALQRAERASIQMADLIDDLLAHALAEAGDLVPEHIALTGADGMLTLAGALLGPDDVLEVSGELPAVHADRLAVRQLFANLIDNAVKYARPGVPAVVGVTARRQGSRVVVEVRDNGVGVDEHERTLIFQRFHRSDAVRAGFRGTGMGLSICQTIVHRHGGSIECLPAEPGPGSIFRFDLPASEMVVPLPESSRSGERASA